MPDVQFRITIQTEEASLYFENMAPMPVPRPGEDICVPNDVSGWWRVEKVAWMLPWMRAMTPTMEALVTVSWSPMNDKPAPVYDDELGWTLPPRYPD